ncbi:MAG: hypothetical protein H8D23_36910 [Candidatus Brocadiales bacterium]|nr:hypothetical protein [Candidatus Brocadiales bacterium]
MQPNAAFVNWFQENGIDIGSVDSFNFVDNNYDHVVEIEDVEDALWAIADDLRSRKDNGEFNTYREAYRWGEKYYTQNGKPIKASSLENEYYKAKAQGKVD